MLSDEKTWPELDAELTTSARRYGKVTVTAWHNDHPKLHGRGKWKDCDEPPIVKGSVIRVEVEHLPKPTGRIKKTLWLWWSGTGEPDLDLCWRAYLRRFDIEHTFRFVKGTLLDDTVGAGARTGRPLDPGRSLPPRHSSGLLANSSMISVSPGNGDPTRRG